MATSNETIIDAGNGRFIKAWVQGVPFEEEAREQLIRTARLPFIHKYIAAMPDVHLGKGATIGSVIPTLGAIVPAAVGVDIGCGMMAVKTTLRAEQLPDNLKALRNAIERKIPHGRTDNGGRNDRGAWRTPPEAATLRWAELKGRFDRLVEKHPRLEKANNLAHLGTLGTGNHFVEVCLDEQDFVWMMLHSGSRGVGNKIGSYFIELAKKDMQKWFINLPDKDLAYFPEGTDHFDDYVEAVGWAQDFARQNRETMMEHALQALSETLGIPFKTHEMAVNCHHNYVQKERHFGKDVWLTRKGAVSAQEDELGIIPGSMGARSFIVRGLGNRDSFCTCSHGAGRSMSRKQAHRTFSVDDHIKATEGVECRKDGDVIDETPMAYKSIDAVMEAQQDLVEVVHTLKQIVCVKG